MTTFRPSIRYLQVEGVYWRCDWGVSIHPYGLIPCWSSHKNCLFHIPTKVNYKAVPWVTFTDPEVAHVGLTYQEIPPNSKTLLLPFKDNDRAQAEGETTGFIKVTTTQKGRILSVSIVGAQAGELVLPWGLVMDKNLKIRVLTDVIAPYPTLSGLSFFFYNV